MNRENLMQLSAYARVDGGWVGGVWIISFFLFIGAFKSALLGNLSFLLGLVSLYVYGRRLRAFRNNALDGEMSMLRAYTHGLFTFFYAAVLMAGAQFLYFQFFDHGYVMSAYMATLQKPEFKDLMTLNGISAKDLDMAITGLQAMRPIDITLQFLFSNLLLGAVLSLPFAAIMSRRKRVGTRR